MVLNSKAREAIRQLFETYQHDIYRFALYSLHDESMARDVVQEVFLRAIRSWHRFRNDANPKTWLLSITRNYMLDTFRKKKKHKQILQLYQLEDAETYESIERVHENVVLENALQSIKENYRQVFILRHVEDLSVGETAKVLKWTEGKVRTTDYRAIAKLRELLDSTAVEVNL